MKLYKNLVNAVAQAVQEVILRRRYADKAIEYLFKQNPQWGSRDRRFVAEGVYDIIRNYRLYSTLAQSENNFWFITAVWLVIKEIEIPEWPEFRHLNPELILQTRQNLKSNPPVYESYPDWLWELGCNELGKTAWEKEAVAMNGQAFVYLRANALKTTRENLVSSLQKDSIEALEVEGFASALRLVRRENVFKSRQFKEGLFEVQDAGSQQISEFLQPLQGDTVIDACAGAGGKSLHLAALMKNKGRIISMDVEERKLDELKKRARRAGAFNIETRLIEKNKTILNLEGKADKVLLDVPCSGLGVLKRNPDTKWKLSVAGIEETKNVQEDILNNYSKMLKAGGTLVYSTCSILPSENRRQVDKFLGTNQGFELLEEKNSLPSEGYDGFYMARIVRRK